MTREEFIAALYANYNIVRNEVMSAHAHWIDLAIDDKFVAIELGSGFIGVSLVDEFTHFGGHDRTFVDAAAALEYIRRLRPATAP